MRKLYWILGSVAALISLLVGVSYVALSTRNRTFTPTVIPELSAEPIARQTSVVSSPPVAMTQGLPPTQIQPTQQVTRLGTRPATMPLPTPARTATSEQVLGEPTNMTSFATANASSTLAPEKTQRFGVVRFDPSNALDQDLTTSWVEGAAGPGVGEQLVLIFSRPVRATRVGFDTGFDRDKSIFYANNRVQSAQLIFSDGSVQTIELLDQRGIQYVPIADVTTTSIAIVITTVYPGSHYDDTPIAEVEVWGYEAQ
jgi:hypothetical protein